METQRKLTEAVEVTLDRLELEIAVRNYLVENRLMDSNQPVDDFDWDVGECLRGISVRFERQLPADALAQAETRGYRAGRAFPRGEGG